jgi:hypothetical protein
MSIILPGRSTGKKRILALIEFAKTIAKISQTIGFKVSSRGWAYLLEQAGAITKAQFDRVEGLINDCRTLGILPVDFVAEEESRQFSGVETPDTADLRQYLTTFLRAAMSCEDYYTPDWWDGEEYYIQMVVEKIDLKSLFEPVCRDYHIPIATSRGWSSILQRAQYARRFQQAKQKGLKCVLLYCGDHDPDGLRISEFLRTNLRDISRIYWTDGTKGYDPGFEGDDDALIIERFGLNRDFIDENSLTWIDNLITGSGRNLASPSHPNNSMQYVQDYLSEHGARKCEANALVVRPEQGRELCRKAIEDYLGDEAVDRFERKRDESTETISEIRENSGVEAAIRRFLDQK